MIVELQRTNSIRGAAETLNITQSALSKTLKEMESLFGTRLYDRSAHGVTPTAAGLVAARCANLLLAELDCFAREIRGAEIGEEESLRIGILSYLGATFLPGVLTRLSGDRRAGRLQLEEDWSGPLLEKLAEGSLDMILILCTEEMAVALEEPAFAAERLFDEELAVVAAPEHALAGRERIALSELAEEKWLLSYQPSLTRITVDAAFLRAGCRPPRPFIESTALSNQLEGAAAGLGIAATPSQGSEQMIRSGRLVRLDVHPRVPLSPLMLLYRRSIQEHPRLVALRDAVRKEFEAKQRLCSERL